MDTSFWGPPGHKLLHSIAYCHSFDFYENIIPKKIISSFFKSIKYVLPCIYCRRSYTKYLKELPLKNVEKNYFKWYYKIHNKINNKLRDQGYLSKKNPKYSTVLRKYQRYIKKINCMIGWDFLYSIVFEYPSYSFEISKSRYNGYITFFTNLKFILPCKKIRNIYKNYIERYPVENYMSVREDFKKWLYNLEKKIKKNCSDYTSRCKKIEKYRVKKCENNSCRK
jgi:hypothetical protein